MKKERLQEIITEELLDILIEGITKNFSRAVEAYRTIQLKQQELRKRFVSEKDPKKKEALKQSLITIHKKVQKAEEEFNRVLKTEPVEDEFNENLTEANQYKTVSNKFKHALDVLPEKYFNRKGVLALIKKLKEKDPEAALAYTMDAFGWMKGMQENKLNESPMDEFTKELNGENIKAKIYTATGDGRSVEAQFTNKKWDDGVPVTKYLTRGGSKSVKTPKGKFKVIETEKFWYYEIKNGWVAVSTKKYGTPPFEY